MPFYLTRPSDEAVRALLARHAGAPFTYAEVGRTREELRAAPAGYVLDRYGSELGRGALAFDRARAALARLDNYPSSFTRVVRSWDEPHEGVLFATVARHLGFWSAHPCRLLYVIDEDEPRRFGLGFGTLPGHSERGEERFLVTLDADERVHYHVQAFSRPTGLLTRLGAPVARAYQLRFQRETLEVMRARAAGAVPAGG